MGYEGLFEFLSFKKRRILLIRTEDVIAQPFSEKFHDLCGQNDPPAIEIILEPLDFAGEGFMLLPVFSVTGLRVYAHVFLFTGKVIVGIVNQFM